MSSEPETQTAGQSAATSAPETAEQAAAAASKQEEKPANSLESRLLAMDAKESKKALHGSRTLKRLGIVFYVLGGLMLLVELILFAWPRLPGFPREIRTVITILTWALLPLVVVLPAFGYTLRKWRSNAAKWLFRVFAVLEIVGGVLQMIQMVRGSNIGGFIGWLVSVLVSIRLLVITYNDILFGSDPPSHNQLGYIRSKWKAGQKPDHVPEHVHKLPKYAKACFYGSFLIIPYVIYLTGWGISDQVTYSKAQEYYEAGQTAFAEAGQAPTAQQANEKYTVAYINFSLAEIDPKNEDVQVYLGLCAARGLGCAKDEKKAFRHLTKFPETTNFFPDAQYELALLYLYGRGTDRDVAQAAILLKSAAQKGQRDAKALLGYDMSDLDENGNETGSDEDAFKEPDYGGKTVEEYLEEKIERESLVKNG